MARNAAIIIEPTKQYLAESRLARLSTQEGYSSVQHLLAELRAIRRPSLERKVLDAMTNNETSFFRDLQPFEALRSVLLPELMTKRATSKSLILWSAACSTGQEPYSLAMMIREHAPALLGWNLSIIATDLSTAALARAQAGRYSQMEVNRGLPAALLLRFFRRDGVDWVINDEIRRMVTFRHFNLSEPWAGIPQVDVLMMRNVLIYFDDQTKRDILTRASRVLNREGYLVLGSAESPSLVTEAYQPVSVARTVCYRLR